MTLDKIVDAYLAVAAMVDEPGCPVFSERIDERTFCNPVGMLLGHLDEAIRKNSVTAAGAGRRLMHRDQPLVYSPDHRRWRLEDSRVDVDTALIKVKERG